MLHNNTPKTRANINKGCVQKSPSTHMHSKTILWDPTIFYIGHKNQLLAFFWAKSGLLYGSRKLLTAIFSHLHFLQEL